MIKKIMNNEVVGSITLEEVLTNVKVENIIDMLLMPDEGIQTVSILIKDDQENKVNYLMQATKGFEIHGINTMLRSLNLGITIEYIDFNQYELMIDYCMNLIRTKKKAIA